MEKRTDQPAQNSWKGSVCDPDLHVGTRELLTLFQMALAGVYNFQKHSQTHPGCTSQHEEHHLTMLNNIPTFPSCTLITQAHLFSAASKAQEPQQDETAATQLLQGTKQAGVAWGSHGTGSSKQPKETRAHNPRAGRGEKTHPLQWRMWLNNTEVKKGNKDGRVLVSSQLEQGRADGQGAGAGKT